VNIYSPRAVARKREIKITKQQTTHTHTHTISTMYNYDKLQKWQKLLSKLSHVVINFWDLSFNV